MLRPATRFVETPKGYVGYQVFGRDRPDLVFLSNWMTNVDLYWDEPSAVRFLDRLGSMGRVFLIDKRGSGVSDPPSRGYIDPVEDTLDDIRAVLDRHGSTEAALIGDTEGGSLACVLAAFYPERFPTLILVNSWARLSRAQDYPAGAPPHVMEALAADWASSFGVNAETLAYTPRLRRTPISASAPRTRTSSARPCRQRWPGRHCNGSARPMCAGSFPPSRPTPL